MRFIFIALAALCFTVTSAFSAQEKDWTFLLFLNGKNNLDTFGDLNINQMEKVGSTDKVNMVVQWGTLRRPTVDRLYIQKDNDFNRITSPVVENIGRTDMGDHNKLEEFILWGMEKYPAKHYFVAVWDHGSGWHKVLGTRNARSGIRINDISWDDTTNNSITTEQLGDVMRRVHAKSGKKIDIYGSDACLMAMAEVAGEMKDSVEYFVGSQDLEPGEGWPYTEVFQRWTALDHAMPADVAKILTEEYVKSYMGGSNGNRDVTFSAYNMAAYDEFAGAVSQLSDSIVSVSSTQKENLVAAVNSTFNFYYSDYADFGDFLKQLSTSKVNINLADAIARANNAMNDFVLINRVSPQFEKATGVAIWLPKYSYDWESYANRYSGLVFSKDTGWDRAIESYLK